MREKPYPQRFLLGAEEKAAVDKLFDNAIASGVAIGYNGPVEEAYCSQFAEYFGGGYADAVNGGTTAVHVALRALDLPSFSEVIVGCVTDPGGMMPIPLMNLIPIVADSDYPSYNTGPKQIEPLITERTSAILIAHLGGEPADIEGIMELANKHNLPVIEDCAQALGAKVNGKLLGTFGKVASFSTMFGKHICTGSQGGMVFTKDKAIGDRVRQVSDRGKPYGLPAGSTNNVAALNHNLGDLQAVIGSEQLKKLDGIVARRQKAANALIEKFKSLKSITVPELVSGGVHSYWFWRLVLNTDKITCDKDTYMAELRKHKVVINPNYSAALPSEMEWFKTKSVFGTPGYPWTASEYKGNPNQEFPIPNAKKTMEVCFNLMINESWGEQEVEDCFTAFKSAEEMFAK